MQVNLTKETWLIDRLCVVLWTKTSQAEPGGGCRRRRHLDGGPPPPRHLLVGSPANRQSSSVTYLFAKILARKIQMQNEIRPVVTHLERPVGAHSATCLRKQPKKIYNSIRERLRELALLKSSQTMTTEATSTAAAATHNPTPTFEAWLQNIL